VVTNTTPSLQLELEELLSKQTQSFLLAITKGKAQHKGFTEKEKHDITRLQLSSMQWFCRGNTNSSVYSLFFYYTMLRLVKIQVRHSIGRFQALQSFKDQLHVPFFMEVIILMCRSIWKAPLIPMVKSDITNFKRLHQDGARAITSPSKKTYSP
jgi:hypothetical protein